jgi:hypothetical protein
MTGSLRGAACGESDAVTRALLLEHRETGDPFWSSLLLAGYHPMLARLRARTVSPQMTADDLDQLVVMGFLVEIGTMSLKYRSHYPVRLRQRVSRRVFTAVAAQTHVARHFTFTVLDDDKETGPDPALRPDEECMLRDDVRATAARLALRTPDRWDPVALDLWLASMTTGDDLDAYVARLRPADPEERRRTFQRLKRRRTRAIPALRSAYREAKHIRTEGEL